jgi:uncharacterized protein (TIGR03435 family)
MRNAGLFACLCLLAASAGAQTFEAAEVRVSPPNSSGSRTAFLPNGRYEFKGATMLELISEAWSLEPEYVYGGPNWLGTERFDIVAKAPAASTEADRLLMLRALLADRFKLVARKDTKPLPVYALTAGKRGVQFQKSDGKAPQACESTREEGTLVTVSYTCANTTMAKLAANLRPRDRSALSHPVVDLTGVAGAWDFTLKYSPLVQLQRAHAGVGGTVSTGGSSLFDALEKAGLKLERQTHPVPVLSVESVNRAPSGNAAEITKSLPPAPTEFEVAEIRPSRPGTKPGFTFKPGGRLEAQAIPLKTLIGVAWSFDDDSMIVGAPKWMESAQFDIIAKAPGAGADVENYSEDALRLMLRSLLIDRFKMTAHSEDRPMPVYELLPGKRPHKMTAADPQSRSECVMSVGQTGSGASAIPLRIMTCRNTTMAQFAEQVHVRAKAYLDHPVVDKTGLQGGWDFTVTWTGKGMLQAARNKNSEEGASDHASDPGGGLTVFESVDRNLGLKLEGGRKDPLPVLAIDRAEQLTADN